MQQHQEQRKFRCHAGGAERHVRTQKKQRPLPDSGHAGAPLDQEAACRLLQDVKSIFLSRYMMEIASWRSPLFVTVRPGGR